LSCSNLKDRDRWVEALQNACELASPDTKYQTPYGIVSQQTGELISLKLKKNKVVELKFEGTEIPENIGVAVASALRFYSSLKKLSISIQMNGARTHELGDVVGLALASALEKHTGINDLHLGCCSFTNQTGLAIASAIAKNPSLKKFSMYNCTNIDDQTLALMVAALEKNVVLEELSLSEMLLGDEAGIAISNMLSKHQTLQNLTFNQGGNKWASIR
jgi:Ran GTPase-activating protein (RanGAP) involved in mRNA processing and transport